MMRILLVDDDVSTLHLMTRVLSRAGHAVRAVTSAEAALLALDDAEMVITDLRLGGMDGIELARRIKAAANAPRVVVVTGYAQPETEMAARAAGCDEYLAKPFLLDDLNRILDSHKG